MIELNTAEGFKTTQETANFKQLRRIVKSQKTIWAARQVERSNFFCAVESSNMETYIAEQSANMT